jgi:hypothetical protein
MIAVKGDSLTAHEEHLLSFGDVTDTDQLHDVAALRSRQNEVGILGRYRLQMRINTVEAAVRAASDAIDRAGS